MAKSYRLTLDLTTLQNVETLEFKVGQKNYKFDIETLPAFFKVQENSKELDEIFEDLLPSSYDKNIQIEVTNQKKEQEEEPYRLQSSNYVINYFLNYVDYFVNWLIIYASIYDLSVPTASKTFEDPKLNRRLKEIKAPMKDIIGILNNLFSSENLSFDYCLQFFKKVVEKTKVTQEIQEPLSFSFEALQYDLTCEPPSLSQAQRTKLLSSLFALCCQNPWVTNEFFNQYTEYAPSLLGHLTTSGCQSSKDCVLITQPDKVKLNLKPRILLRSVFSSNWSAFTEATFLYLAKNRTFNEKFWEAYILQTKPITSKVVGVVAV
jgi:hypothetical protein